MRAREAAHVRGGGAQRCHGADVAVGLSAARHPGCIGGTLALLLVPRGKAHGDEGRCCLERCTCCCCRHWLPQLHGNIDSQYACSEGRPLMQSVDVLHQGLQLRRCALKLQLAAQQDGLHTPAACAQCCPFASCQHPLSSTIAIQEFLRKNTEDTACAFPCTADSFSPTLLSFRTASASSGTSELWVAAPPGAALLGPAPESQAALATSFCVRHHTPCQIPGAPEGGWPCLRPQPITITCRSMLSSKLSRLPPVASHSAMAKLLLAWSRPKEQPVRKDQPTRVPPLCAS